MRKSLKDVIEELYPQKVIIDITYLLVSSSIYVLNEIKTKPHIIIICTENKENHGLFTRLGAEKNIIFHLDNYYWSNEKDLINIYKYIKLDDYEWASGNIKEENKTKVYKEII